MALVLEDGSGLSTANAYVSLNDCAAYCVDHGLTFVTSPSSLGEQAIIRATAAIDATYRGRFPGYKANLREQALEWPRQLAYDVEDNLIDGNEVPIEVVNATCEAAVRELESPGSVLPDLERGGSVKRLKAGSVEIEYGANASPQTTFQLINGILSGILTTGSGGGLFGVASRG
jgi:hypothetical protein